MSWRPDDWPKCPCDDCKDKIDDVWGRFCNLACGKWSAWLSQEAGADAMLEALKKYGFCASGDAPTLCYGKGSIVFIPDEEE